MMNLKKFISYEDDLRWKCVFEILYYCGLRKGELKGLTWKDIYFDKKDYKNCRFRIAKTEIEIYKAREKANHLLEEIKEITLSEEKYRSIVTKLKTKYRSEIKTAVMGERTITIKNLTPILPPKEREQRKREVEQKLFDVFSKYAGQRV